MCTPGVTSIKPEFILPPTQEEEDNHQIRAAKKIKVSGQNHHRPHLIKEPNKQKLCKFLWKNNNVDNINDFRSLCALPSCYFSHDVKTFIDEKANDIGSACYNYATYGSCRFGLTCRFGENHIESYKDKINEDLWSLKKNEVCIKNTLSKELRTLLRSRKYDFHLSYNICKAFQKIKDEKLLKTFSTECPNWNDKLYLAPLTTVGNLPYRRVCKKFGADITCSEMAMAHCLLSGSYSEWALVKRHRSEDIFGIQLCGSNVEVMIKCAQVLEEHADFDFIDINMGCPIDLVYKKGGGSALLRRVGVLEKMVCGMNSVLTRPVTLKMRTAIYHNNRVAHSVIEKAKLWDVSQITLHGRSREQRFLREADWSYIEECAKIASPIPLYGNGDIFSYDDHNFRCNMSAVSGVMIARGALIKPWIFTEIKEHRNWDISSSERLDILKDYVNYGLEHWGSDNEGVEKTRRFLLEWLSFLYRYIPVGLLDSLQKINQRPPPYKGRNEMETLMASNNVSDWVKISEIFLGKAPSNFNFVPKHKANSWE